MKSCLRTYSIFKISSLNISKSELQNAIKENRSIEGYYLVPSSNRRLYIKFESGDPNLPLVLDTHGLGDTHQDMNSLNQIINNMGKGYRTLRVDTHLNGKTLENYLAENNFQLPPFFHFKKNTYDISALLKDTHVNEIFLVGHSYGGGLVWDITTYIYKYFNYSLMKEINKNAIKIKGIVQMSPYLQRADKYQAEKLQNLTVIPETINLIVSTLASFGMPESFLEQISAPWVNLSIEQVNEIKKSLLWPKQILQSSTQQKAHDVIMDPFMDQFMVKNFTAYFVYKAKLQLQKTELSDSDMAIIQKKVEACIALTKGIRTFDILDSGTSLKWPKDIPVLLIGGEKDTLVSPLQLQEFTLRLSEANIPFEFHVIEDGTHLFPQTHAPQAAALILNFFNKILNPLTSNIKSPTQDGKAL